MIAEFNRKQTALAILNFIVGSLAALLAGAFFWFAVTMVLGWLDFKLRPNVPAFIAVGCVVFVFVLGVLEHRRGGGHSEFHESDLYPGFDLSTGSGYWANDQIQRVSAPAYFLSQIFLAAPLQWIGGISRLRSRIPASPELERELGLLLKEVNAKPTWHPLSNYSHRAREMGYLIRMEKIQFSPRKGTVRPL